MNADAQPVPDVSHELLDQFVRQDVVDGAASAKAPRSRRRIVPSMMAEGQSSSGVAYNYPDTSIDCVIPSPSTPDETTRVKYMRRLEAYAAAFPAQKIDPNAAFRMDVKALGAFTKRTEMRLASLASASSSIVGSIIEGIGGGIEKTHAFFNGLGCFFKDWVEKNQSAVQVLQIKYFGDFGGVEMAVMSELFKGAAGIYKANAHVAALVMRHQTMQQARAGTPQVAASSSEPSDGEDL